MINIELIYDADCPNVEMARNQLRRALAEIEAASPWQEWDRSDSASPPHARQYGSPTILVDGRDVAGAPPSDGANCCRVYRGETGAIQGVPSSDTIASALRGSMASSNGSSVSNWQTSFAIVPAVGVSLLPKLACPACWPAYAGLLSAVSLGFLTDTAYLLPLTVLFLAMAVGALAVRARRRRDYAPFALGVLAALIILCGKFAFDSNPAMYSGIALLVGISLWNSWPRTPKPTESRRLCCTMNQS